MIPKIIHYCWFGGASLPSLAQKCIESWKRYLPDYEIKEWNEKNFDVECNEYVKEAYKAKKWAFVSDVARFKVLYDEGGIYFDTDVEVIRDMSYIIEMGSFMGSETEKKIAAGLGLGAEPCMPIYKEILEDYEGSRFILEDGSLDLTTVVDRVTKIMSRHGFSSAERIVCIDGINIYPRDYFDPMDMESGRIKITENTVSIHHYMASWCDSSSRLRGKVYSILYRTFGRSFAERARTVFGRK